MIRSIQSTNYTNRQFSSQGASYSIDDNYNTSDDYLKGTGSNNNLQFHSAVRQFGSTADNSGNNNYDDNNMPSQTGSSEDIYVPEPQGEYSNSTVSLDGVPVGSVGPEVLDTAHGNNTTDTIAAYEKEMRHKLEGICPRSDDDTTQLTMYHGHSNPIKDMTKGFFTEQNNTTTQHLQIKPEELPAYEKRIEKYINTTGDYEGGLRMYHEIQKRITQDLQKELINETEASNV